MPVVLVVLVGAIALEVLILWNDGAGILARIFASLELACGLFFCVYGFLATYEPLGKSVQAGARVFYGGLGIACLAGIVGVNWPRRRPPSDSN